MAIIVYTSGTTGPPKGAMLTHRNLLAAAEHIGPAWGTGPGDEVLSYLPLCHVAERLISLITAVGYGYVVNFPESASTMAADIVEIQPTFFLGVPRVWEKMMATTEIRVQDASRLKRLAYRFFMARGQRTAARRLAGGRPGLTHAIGWLLVYRPLRRKMGLLRVRESFSGAAPISPQVLEWFWALGVTVREGYGQTEGTGLGTANRPGAVRMGTVGQAIPAVELRIADDGEILLRSPGVFPGYFKNPEATAATVDPEGWLHSGDVGTLDADGYLTITDRKKDIIITAGGKNISPSEIENKLKLSPYIREAVVIGDRRPYLTALLGIELDTVRNWATRQGLAFTTYADLSAKPEVRALLQEWVDQVNTELAQVETVKRVRHDPPGARPRGGGADRHPESEAGCDLPDVRSGDRSAVRGEAVTDFLQFLVAGVAVGSLYALLALGFVIVYKATGVINFAHGGLLLIGTYLTYELKEKQGLPFYLSVVVAMAACAALGLIIERLVLRHMVGQPVFAVILVTIGLSIAMNQIVTWRWGFDLLNLNDPWGFRTYDVGGVIVALTNIVRVVAAGALLAAFFVFFRRSRYGLAMRATASDQEAAMAQGISAARIFGLSWAIAGATATVAGVLLASGGRGLDPQLSFVPLLAIPAIILGGLDSTTGAVVGGLIIGIVEEMTKGYGPEHLPEFLGQNFHTVTPYVVLVAIMLVRPYGLFGTKEVERL